MKRMDGNTETPLGAPCRTVPISYLHLDLAEPVAGWERALADRGIEVTQDAAGRPSIPRWALAKLIDEQRERERRLAEEAAAKAATLVQPVGVGVPAIEDGDAYASMMVAGAVSPAEEFGAVPRPNFLQEELEAGARRQAAEREAVRWRKEARRDENR
jgi:hypothetical protein